MTCCIEGSAVLVASRERWTRHLLDAVADLPDVDPRRLRPLTGPGGPLSG